MRRGLQSRWAIDATNSPCVALAGLSTESEVALAYGLTREVLYKALGRTSQPVYDTISKVCAALGVKLVAVPINNQCQYFT